MEQYKTHNGNVIITYKKGRTVIDFDNDELAEFRAKCCKSIDALDMPNGKRAELNLSGGCNDFWWSGEYCVSQSKTIFEE